MKITDKQIKLVIASFERIAYEKEYSPNYETITFNERSEDEVSAEITKKMYDFLIQGDHNYKHIFPSGAARTQLECTVYGVFREIIRELIAYNLKHQNRSETTNSINSAFYNGLIDSHKVIKNNKTEESVALKKNHFDDVGTALIKALKKAEEENWNEATKNAWLALYGDIYSIMKIKLESRYV